MNERMSNSTKVNVMKFFLTDCHEFNGAFIQFLKYTTLILVNVIKHVLKCYSFFILNSYKNV